MSRIPDKKTVITRQRKTQPTNQNKSPPHRKSTKHIKPQSTSSAVLRKKGQRPVTEPAAKRKAAFRRGKANSHLAQDGLVGSRRGVIEFPFNHPGQSVS